MSQWGANPSQAAEEQLIISQFAEAHRISQVSLSPPAPHEGLNYLQEIRVKMREMGAATTAEIEPEQQTALLDGCISLPGVIGGGVPGGMFAPYANHHSC